MQHASAESVGMPSIHVAIIGTGLCALSLARTLLLSPVAASLRLSLVDKAKAPGGRLSTRTYDSGVLLETGARNFVVSPRHESTFGKEVARWEQHGWVKEVVEERRRGVMSEGRWYEGVGGGVTRLVDELVAEIKTLAGEDRLQIHYNVQATNPTPTSLSDQHPILTTIPPIDLAPISLLIHTAPSPQVDVLLPYTSVDSTKYIQTLALLLPTLSIPDLPAYWRDPSPLLTSIATGWTSITDETPIGLVFQSTPQRLGVVFEKDISDDDAVRKAFWKAIVESRMIPSEVISHGETLSGRQSQVKRWKFAQIENAIAASPPRSSEREVIVLEGGRVMLAGDGSGGEQGGVEGSWRSAQATAKEVVTWIEASQLQQLNKASL